MEHQKWANVKLKNMKNRIKAIKPEGKHNNCNDETLIESESKLSQTRLGNKSTEIR